MANLSVRNLDDTVCERLRLRALQHGVSMEEEVRRIIQRSVAVPERLGSLAVECFGPQHGVELELSERTPHDPVAIGG